MPCHCNLMVHWCLLFLHPPGNMDKYRLVEEKFIGAKGFIDDITDTRDVKSGTVMEEVNAQCIVRITTQAKPRSCITTAMNMLVSKHMVMSHGLGPITRDCSLTNHLFGAISLYFIPPGQWQPACRVEGHGQGHQQSCDHCRNIKTQDATPSNNGIVILRDCQRLRAPRRRPWHGCESALC